MFTNGWFHVVRRFLTCAAVMCIALAANAQLANTGWAKIRGNSRNTGLGLGHGAVPVVLWQANFYNVTYDASPVIALDGTVYAGPDGGFNAYDPLTGTSRWGRGASGWSASSVAVGVNTAVYWTWNFYCSAFNPVTGASWWDSDVVNVSDSSPAIGDDNTIYFGCRDQNVYALDGTTGAKKWAFKTGDVVVSSPGIGTDGTIYIGSDDGNVYAINPTDASQKWVYSTGGRVRSSPAIGSDGTVYVTSKDGYLYALNGSTGALVWKFFMGVEVNVGGYLGRSAAIGPDGTIYAGTAGSNMLYAVNPTNGSQIWSFKTDYNSWSSPVVASDGTVYTQELDINYKSLCKLYAINGKTGALIWTFANAPSYSSPAIAPDGTLYVGSETALYALESIHVTSVKASPNPVLGGTNSTGTVTTNVAAPTGGSVVTLASDNVAVVVPATVTVAAGSTSATFTITTNPVSAATPTNITATLLSTQKTVLTVNPASVASISLNPTTVQSGQTSTATVTLNGAAGPDGIVVNLLSSQAAAQVPATVTVPAGLKTVTFIVNTIGVDTQQTANISATSTGPVQSAPLVVTPSTLQSLTVNPSTIGSGGTATGTVTMSGPAGPSGALVLLSSSSQAAGLPASVTIMPQQTTATFVVTAGGVNATAYPMLTASFAGVDQTAVLTINPATMVSLALNPTTVVGGNPSVGTITMTGPAGTGGRVISLSSSLSSVTVPAKVTVPAGLSSVTFNIGTSGVASNSSSTIMATLGSQTQTATLSVTAASLVSVGLNPSTVQGGSPSVGTVTLSGNAGPSGATISLTSDNSAATVPSTVLIPAGQKSATFSVTTVGVNTQSTASIKAGYNGQQQVAILTITSAILSSVSVSPTSVIGGNTATGTVKLNGAAGQGGMVVSLSSSNSVATVPATVTVLAGASTATFSIATSAVSTQALPVITATLSGVSQTANLAVVPATLTALSLNPTVVVGGLTSTGTVTLNGVAGPNGTPVLLTSNNAVAMVPALVTVPAGQSSATFTVSTTSVAALTNATISAAQGGVTKTASLSLTAVTLASVSLNPASVAGATTSTGTVTLSGPANAGGLTISLMSSNKSAVVPSSVTIPAGQMSATFTVTASAVTVQTVATISASLNGFSDTATLTMSPISLASLSFNPNTVIGGAGSVGTATLNGLAPKGGIIVKLKSGSKFVVVPASVTIPAGQMSATFKATTTATPSPTVVVVTGTQGAISQTATLTVNQAALVSLTLSPTSVTGGKTSTGTITVSGPAPTGGLLVTVTSSSTSAVPPKTVIIPAGKSSGTFTVKTTKVTTKTTATISASVGGAAKTATLTIS